MKPRECPECKTPLYGRVDKKFCSDQCRNTFHNRINRDTLAVVRNTNNILRRNRRILEELNVKEKQVVKRKTMGERGYDFRYHTESFTTRNGKQYFFCYDLGFFGLDDDAVMIVKRQDS
jgi:hypothetical protein